MFNLTKKIEFSLIILKHFEEKNSLLSKEDREKKIIVKAHEIATTYKISETFIAKIMQKLCKHKILLSIQGINGGYYVNQDIKNITFLRLMEILEGKFTIVNCINENKECIHNDGCSIIDPMRNLNVRFREIYNNLTIGEIIHPTKKPFDKNDGSTSLSPSTAVSNTKTEENDKIVDFFMQQVYISKLLKFFNKFSLNLTKIKTMMKNLLLPNQQRRSLSTSKKTIFYTTLLLIVFSVNSLLGLGTEKSVNVAGEVNVYSYRQKFLIDGILEKFTEQTGIKANTIYIKKGIAERIKLEGELSPADVILTVDIGRLIGLEEAGVIQPVISSVINNTVSTDLRHPENLWFALTTRARIIYSSKSRVKNGEIKNYEDLADKKWNGRVCTRSGYHPYNLALFASLIANNGLDKTKQFLKDLKSNLARRPQGNDRAQVKAIKEGLCDVAIGNSYYYGKMLYNHKEPEQIQWAKSVNLIFPNQDNHGTHQNISGMAMAKHSPNRKNAKMLMEFLVSELAQYIYSTENFEFPVKESTPLSPFLKTFMSGVKWDNIDINEVAKNRKQVTILLDEIKFDQ